MTSISSDANLKEETKSKDDEEFNVYTLLDEEDGTENYDMVLLSLPPGWPYSREKLICKDCLARMDETINGDDFEDNQLTPTHVVDGDKVNEVVNMQPEYDETIDERLPETVTLLKTPDGGKLYLIGTAHFSVESQNDVATIIRAVQPHVVAVELCRDRLAIMQYNEEALFENAAVFDFRTVIDILKEFGIYKGLMHIVLNRKVADIVKQLGMPPGGEFRIAFEEAKKIPDCMIHLADRSIEMTFQRTLCQLTWWEIIKLLWMVVRMDARISKEDVEKLKGKNLIAEMVGKLKEEFPSIERTFIRERDMFLTYSLQVSTQRGILKPDITEPLRIVAVVGIGHVSGITELWGTVNTEDIRPIMRVPPQALSTKILKYTLKISLLGIVLFVGYKFIPLTKTNTFETMKTSIAGLFQSVIMDANAGEDEYEHDVPGVMYVARNIPGPGIDLDEFESEYSVGCSCTARCDSDRCTCTRATPNYIDGLIVDEDKSSGPIMECNSRCTCGSGCGNRVVQNGPLDCLVVREVGGKGLGLFTSKSIRKSQFICEYAGEVIGVKEARHRVEANKNSTNYVLVVTEHVGDRSLVTCIDPKQFGNIGRYANHSCEPNANLVPIRVEGSVPRLCLFASRDIGIGEEITFNYAGGVNSVRNSSVTRCLCGSNNCSGYLPHNSI